MSHYRQVLVDSWINLTLLYNSLQFSVHCYTYTSLLSHGLTSLLIKASNSGRSAFVRFPNYACASADYSQQLLLLLVTANIVPSSLILSTLMMEAICSSKTSVHTKATRPHIAEDGILRSHRCENLKSYIALTDWAL
jgi:hypothetical protein